METVDSNFYRKYTVDINFDMLIYIYEVNSGYELWKLTVILLSHERILSQYIGCKDISNSDSIFGYRPTT